MPEPRRLDHPVALLDSTLREGEQAAGVRFSLEQKLTLAKRLDAFGVDFIEAGHPVVSEAVREAVTAIQQLRLRATVLAHARAARRDIEAVAACGVRWVGIFCGINRYTLECKLRMTKAQALGRIVEMIGFAKSLGLSVRYSCEDAPRTDPDELEEVCRRAVEAGADRLSVVDTVGLLTPRRMAGLVRRLRAACRVGLHVHCHNDFGMAVANAISAVEAGATVVDVTVNGLGERSGIPPLAEVCAALKTLYQVPNAWDLAALPELSRLVARYTGIPVGRHRPVVGEFAFAHKAGLHSAAVLRDPASYEALDPASVGARRRIIIDEFSGTSALRGELARRGVACDGARAARIVRRLKSVNGRARRSARPRAIRRAAEER